MVDTIKSTVMGNRKKKRRKQREKTAFKKKKFNNSGRVEETMVANSKTRKK